MFSISNEFDIDLWVTFMNFQTCSWSGCIVNMIGKQQLHASCCNFTKIFSTSKSQTSLMMTLV